MSFHETNPTKSFLHHIFRLTFKVEKWLFILVLFVSSLSEIVHCGWINNHFLIPIGMWESINLVRILKETTLELSGNLQMISLKRYVAPYMFIMHALDCDTLWGFFDGSNQGHPLRYRIVGVLYINAFQFIHVIYTLGLVVFYNFIYLLKNIIKVRIF